MKWFIVKIVFGISVENTTHLAQFDEQLRLIQANDQEEAFLKARMLGLREEHSFMNDKENLVRWEFINVSEVWPLSAVEDGCELYSNILQPEDAAHYVSNIHKKAVAIRSSAFNQLQLS